MISSIKSLASQKGQTLSEVAAACGVSRSQLFRIAKEDSFGSPDFWRAMISWSGGRITPNAKFAAEIEKATPDEGAAA